MLTLSTAVNFNDEVLLYLIWSFKAVYLLTAKFL